MTLNEAREKRADEPALALRPRDAARMLGVCRKTLYVWTKRGLLPHIRVGSVVLYPRRDLERWLTEMAGRERRLRRGDSGR